MQLACLGARDLALSLQALNALLESLDLTSRIQQFGGLEHLGQRRLWVVEQMLGQRPEARVLEAGRQRACLGAAAQLDRLQQTQQHRGVHRRVRLQRLQFSTN